VACLLCGNADKRVSAKRKSPRQFLRAGNPDAPVGHHVDFFSADKATPRRGAKICAMMCAGHPERCGQSPRTAGQFAPAFVPSPLLHGSQSAPRFDRANQNKSLLIAFGQHIEHPMHPVVQIHIGRPRAMTGDESARRRTRERMARRIADRRIGFAFHHNPATRAPDQFASHQRLRALDR